MFPYQLVIMLIDIVFDVIENTSWKTCYYDDDDIHFKLRIYIIKTKKFQGGNFKIPKQTKYALYYKMGKTKTKTFCLTYFTRRASGCTCTRS